MDEEIKFQEAWWGKAIHVSSYARPHKVEVETEQGKETVVTRVVVKESRHDKAKH